MGAIALLLPRPPERSEDVAEADHVVDDQVEQEDTTHRGLSSMFTSP